MQVQKNYKELLKKRTMCFYKKCVYHLAYAMHAKV